MKPPNLLLVTLEYPPHVGGVARYLSGLVEAAEGAIEVIVPRLQQHGWPRWWPIVRLCWNQKQKQTTILVSHVFPVGTAAWISRLMGGPEYIVLFHGVDVRLAHGVWKQWLLRRICHRARLLLVNSESTRRDLYKRIPNVAPIVLTPGVGKMYFPTREEARKQLGVPADAQVILSVARLVPRKGIDSALQAIARLKDKERVRYIVIGDGPDRDRLQVLGDRLGIRPNWIPVATDQERDMWLASADLFFLPGREEGEHIEGFGIVFLEAAAAGLPVIAGKSGGASEAVVDGVTGFLVDPHSIEQMTNVLERLLVNPILRHQLGETGRERVKKEFDWRERWKMLSTHL